MSSSLRSALGMNEGSGTRRCPCSWLTGRTGGQRRKVQPGKCSQNRGLGSQLRPGGLVGRDGPSREMGSQLGLQSQVVVGPLIQEWGERVVPAGGNSMSAARVQAVAKGRNVLCALVSERQCGCPVCSTERSVPYRERGCSPVTAHSRPPRPTGAWGRLVTVSQPTGLPPTRPAGSLRSHDQWDEFLVY